MVMMLTDDTPRSTRYGGNQLSWWHPAACPGPSAASEVLPLPKRHHGLQQTCSVPHFSLDAPMRSDTPPRLPLAHALPYDTPRQTRHGGNQLSWRHPAACPNSLALAPPLCHPAARRQTAVVAASSRVSRPLRSLCGLCRS